MISVHNTDLIDYEMSPRVRLIVQAAAGGVVAYATVWVNLTDVNDNVPKFTQNKYITSVWENNAPETFVTMVTASKIATKFRLNLVLFKQYSSLTSCHSFKLRNCVCLVLCYQ